MIRMNISEQILVSCEKFGGKGLACCHGESCWHPLVLTSRKER